MSPVFCVSFFFSFFLLIFIQSDQKIIDQSQWVIGLLFLRAICLIKSESVVKVNRDD